MHNLLVTVIYLKLVCIKILYNLSESCFKDNFGILICHSSKKWTNLYTSQGLYCKLMTLLYCASSYSPILPPIYIKILIWIRQFFKVHQIFGDFFRIKKMRLYTKWIHKNKLVKSSITLHYITFWPNSSDYPIVSKAK